MITSQIFEKKFWWAKWAKIGPKTSFFFIFSSFGSLVFLEIAFNNTLQQCLTCSIGKIHENKFFEPKYGPKWPKSVPKQGFFCLFLKFGLLIFLEIACNVSLQQCLTCSRGKIHKKKFIYNRSIN